MEDFYIMPKNRALAVLFAVPHCQYKEECIQALELSGEVLEEMFEEDPGLIEDTLTTIAEEDELKGPRLYIYDVDDMDHFDDGVCRELTTEEWDKLKEGEPLWH